jgi:DNA-binding transcriptional regulator YiaG
MVSDMAQKRKTGVSASSGPVSPAAMSREEYTAALSRLGYSQEGFARLVGSSPRTGQKWALGETRIPGCVALLLRLLLRLPDPRALADQLGGLPTRTRTDSHGRKAKTKETAR